MWRSEKIKDFVFRLKCLGLEGEPQFAELLGQIAHETEAVEEIAGKQKESGYERPWWQDGEYDSRRADR